MIRNTVVPVLALILLTAACAPAAAPPPVVVPTGEDRFLVDPRIGYSGAATEDLESGFETAWRWLLAGDELEARRRLDELQRREPAYLPAPLAAAALDLRAGRTAEARSQVEAILRRDPEYLAARIYGAEIAAREGRARDAAELYRALEPHPEAPVVVGERLAQLDRIVFEELLAAAQTASDAESVRLLREALAVRQDATDARILLAQKLVRQGEFDEARVELEPLLNTNAERVEVQELLAEIDFGQRRYQEAIARYDRLAKRTREPRFAQRLETIKREWSAANMPSHYRSALASTSLTRAELATLLYWTVPSIRFAQNLQSPPIAVDLEDIAGREEMIRAIAIGMYDVDPVTRRVSPYRPVTASRLIQNAERVLVRRGAACARGIPQERALEACGIRDSLGAMQPDDPVSGAQAQALLEQLAKVM